MPDWQCNLVALGIDRTFWEKATILHAEHHRPAGKATPDRLSRRDFAAMRDMYLAEPPSFDAVLATLAHLEHRLNEP